MSSSSDFDWKKNHMFFIQLSFIFRWEKKCLLFAVILWIFSGWRLLVNERKPEKNQRKLREPLRTANTLRCAHNHSHVRTALGVVCVMFACQIWTFSSLPSCNVIFGFHAFGFRVKIENCIFLYSVRKRREADDNFKFMKYII